MCVGRAHFLQPSALGFGAALCYLALAASDRADGLSLHRANLGVSKDTTLPPCLELSHWLPLARNARFLIIEGVLIEAGHGAFNHTEFGSRHGYGFGQ